MASVTLTALPNGPYRVEGTIEVLDREGRPTASPHDPIYLCRCGRSAAKPFCDGAHARTAWKDDE